MGDTTHQKLNSILFWRSLCLKTLPAKPKLTKHPDLKFLLSLDVFEIFARKSSAPRPNIPIVLEIFTRKIHDVNAAQPNILIMLNLIFPLFGTPCVFQYFPANLPRLNQTS